MTKLKGRAKAKARKQKRKQKQKHKLHHDYLAFLVIGIIFFPVGMYIENPIISGLGIVFLVLGIYGIGVWIKSVLMKDWKRT